MTFQNDTFMRALGMDFPADPKAWDIADQYLFGPAFLVSPVTQPQATTRDVYLPAGTRWVDFWSGTTHEGGGDVELLHREQMKPRSSGNGQQRCSA